MVRTGSPRGLIYGIGVNDADYHVWSGGRAKRKCCKFYTTWKDMITRCHSEKFKAKYPTYRDCSVTPEWLSFMSFKRWMVEQDWVGNELDKDILVEGNKVYGPDTCLFVSKDVNYFFLKGVSRSLKPSGVEYKEKSNRYIARGRVYLGSYSTYEEAHDVYLSHKMALAVDLASRQSDKRVSDAILSRYK